MTWEVVEVGALVTLQDAGRAGWAHLGVPRAGWLDTPSAQLANRLVGNHESAAVLEVSLGGLRVRVDEATWIAVTGASVELRVAGESRGLNRAERVSAGVEVWLGPATTGVRSYLAVAGGFAVEPVLGSRSTDTLAWVGPPRVEAGVRLPIGLPTGAPVAMDVVVPARPGPLRVDPGPRLDLFASVALKRLCATPYAVLPDSNRIGLRLRGQPVERIRHDELASEGMVLGAIQIPPNGQPVVFLADHPTTGGYPVLAVVRAEDLWQCAQLRPGDSLTFTRA